jgi:hypothetical protein
LKAEQKKKQASPNCDKVLLPNKNTTKGDAYSGNIVSEGENNKKDKGIFSSLFAVANPTQRRKTVSASVGHAHNADRNVNTLPI